MIALILYLVATVLWFFMTACFAADHTIIYHQRRTAARCAIAAPIWPLVIALFAWRGLKTVWETAELGDKK